MANNQPCFSDSELGCEYWSRTIAKALGYPRKVALSGATGKVSVSPTWSGYGDTIPGWTLRPTTTWYRTAADCKVPVDVAMQTALAAAQAQARLTPADRDALNGKLATITTVDLTPYTPHCPGEPTHRRVVPPHLTIYWNGATSDHAQYVAWGASSSEQLAFVDNAHRMPSIWDGFDVWGPGISQAETAAIIEAEIAAMVGRIDGPFIVWYPPAASFSNPADVPSQSGINIALDSFMASPNRSQIKLAVLCEIGWLKYASPTVSDYSKLADYADHLQSLFDDPCYLRIDGKPVLGIYGYGSLPDAPAKTAWLVQWTALKGLLEPIYAVAADGNQEGATAMACNAKTTYGPNPTLPGGTTQYSFINQFLLDHAQWGSSGGLQCALSFTWMQDRRARAAATAYVDQPTALEVLEELNAGYCHYVVGVGVPRLAVTYAWNEIGEGGPGIVPTLQHGEDYLNWHEYAKNNDYPASYVYRLDAHQKNFVTTGAGWTYVQQVAGARNSDEMRSSTTNDAISLTHYRALNLGLVTTVGPDRGKCAIYVDDVWQADVDLYAVSQAMQQLVWNSPTLDGGTHTIKVVVLGTKHASSSSVMVGIDAAQINVQLQLAG